MADLKQLLAQRAALEKQIDDAMRQQRDQAIAQVRDLMTTHGLSMADLQLRRNAAKGAKRGAAAGKVPVKYRNADTGDTWSGRGLKPRWLQAAVGAGRKLEEFRV